MVINKLIRSFEIFVVVLLCRTTRRFAHALSRASSVFLTSSPYLWHWAHPRAQVTHTCLLIVCTVFLLCPFYCISVCRIAISLSILRCNLPVYIFSKICISNLQTWDDLQCMHACNIALVYWSYLHVFNSIHPREMSEEVMS